MRARFETGNSEKNAPTTLANLPFSEPTTSAVRRERLSWKSRNGKACFEAILSAAAKGRGRPREEPVVDRAFVPLRSGTQPLQPARRTGALGRASWPELARQRNLKRRC